MAAPPLRLLTIGFSHYCEKARWALDRAGLDYVEEDHAPLLHWLANLRAGAKRTVPVLVTPRGVLRESSEIVRFADEALPPGERLFPAEPQARAEVETWVDLFDRSLGPATRRGVYFLVLPETERARGLLMSTGPVWERRVTRALFPAIRALMVRGMKVTPEASARSIARVEEIFEKVGERLADGRRYLVGDRFTAADLTFASLAAPVVIPPQYGFPFPPLAEMPAKVQAWVERTRATAAGRFTLRLYAEDRPPVRAQGRSDMASRTS